MVSRSGEQRGVEPWLQARAPSLVERVRSSAPAPMCAAPACTEPASRSRPCPGVRAIAAGHAAPSGAGACPRVGIGWRPGASTALLGVSHMLAAGRTVLSAHVVITFAAVGMALQRTRRQASVRHAPKVTSNHGVDMQCESHRLRRVRCHGHPGNPSLMTPLRAGRSLLPAGGARNQWAVCASGLAHAGVSDSLGGSPNVDGKHAPPSSPANMLVSAQWSSVCK